MNRHKTETNEEWLNARLEPLYAEGGADSVALK
jgi:hypothetical protein